jgi:hypothetical protein
MITGLRKRLPQARRAGGAAACASTRPACEIMSSSLARITSLPQHCNDHGSSRKAARRAGNVIGILFERLKHSVLTACFCRKSYLLEGLLGEVGQDKGSLVDLLVVVLAELVLLGLGPLADGLLEVAAGVKGADHETDLARGVGGDGGVGVLDVGEDLLAVLLELGDQGEVQPLVLSFGESQQRPIRKE